MPSRCAGRFLLFGYTVEESCFSHGDLGRSAGATRVCIGAVWGWWRALAADSVSDLCCPMKSICAISVARRSAIWNEAFGGAERR